MCALFRTSCSFRVDCLLFILPRLLHNVILFVSYVFGITIMLNYYILCYYFVEFNNKYIQCECVIKPVCCSTLTVSGIWRYCELNHVAYFRDWSILMPRNGLFLLQTVRQHLSDALSDAVGNIADKHPTLGLSPMQCIPLHTAIK